MKCGRHTLLQHEQRMIVRGARQSLSPKIIPHFVAGKAINESVWPGQSGITFSPILTGLLGAGAKPRARVLDRRPDFRVTQLVDGVA